MSLRSWRGSYVRGGIMEREESKHPHVSIIDDDVSVRELLPDLLREFGLSAEAFASAAEFLMSGSLKRTDCLILDIGMPGISGPELHQQLKRRGHKIPIIFITARRDEATRSRLLEQGAVECLSKPFSDTGLRDAVNQALKVG